MEIETKEEEAGSKDTPPSSEAPPTSSSGPASTLAPPPLLKQPQTTGLKVPQVSHQRYKLTVEVNRLSSSGCSSYFLGIWALHKVVLKAYAYETVKKSKFCFMLSSIDNSFKYRFYLLKPSKLRKIWFRQIISHVIKSHWIHPFSTLLHRVFLFFM